MLNADTGTLTQVETLTRLNLQDMFDNFGLSGLRRGRRAMERVFWLPAKLLARQLARFDARIGEIGLQNSARELLAQYIHHLDIVGAEQIPAHGGAIFAANHPGMTDTLACFSSIPRADLYAVSLDRPFVRALPHVAQRIFYVSEETGQRLAAVRQIARYLQKGGAVLICPAGHIEPDPAVMDGAIASLDEWSASLGIFAQLAPESVIIPTVVSGVVYAPALNNPLTRLRRTPRDRERVAATIQAFLQSGGWIKSQMKPRIEFGAPLSARALRAAGAPADITRAIAQAVKPLLERAARRVNARQSARTYLSKTHSLHKE
jgi:1-acyl-sn-glycerol-3-phosphate acyltransferase